MNPYGYQAEKLSAARSCLMLPHPQGEAQSIASAFQECDKAFSDLNETYLDDNSRKWVKTIKRLKDTTGVEDPDGRGTYYHKALTLGENEQYELSRAVDELAYWFRSYEGE